MSNFKLHAIAQVILISASIKNHCKYCVATHSFLARNLVKVPEAPSPHCATGNHCRMRN